MNILLVGPIHRKKEFLVQPKKFPFVKGQGQQSWVEAFTSLGHTVSVFRYTDSVFFPERFSVEMEFFLTKHFPRVYSKYLRFRDLCYASFLDSSLRSKKLLTFAKKCKPNIVIISGGVSTLLVLPFLEMKRQFGSKVLLFSGVNPAIAATTLEKTMVKSGIVDVVVENDRGYALEWEMLGAKKTVVLPISSVDPGLHRKVILSKEEEEKYGSDVCFVGSLTRERQQILKSIRQAQDKQVQDDSYTMKIWGDIPQTIKLDEMLKPHYYGVAFGEKMVKIYNAAKIVLNFQPSDMIHGGNMRTFEIPGCGAFQLANRVDSKWFTKGNEVVSFKSIDDLKKKISYYLKNEKKRNEIVENGYLRAHKEHTYEKHFKKLLSQI